MEPPAPAHVILTECGDWLTGAGPESQNYFNWLLTSVGLDPEPWMDPCLPHHYRLSRSPYVIAMHRDQPQIKSCDCWKKELASH